MISFRLPAGITPGVVTSEAQVELKMTGVMATVETDLPQRELYRLTRWAEERSVELFDPTVQRPSLEDVFLELTREDEERA